MRLTILLSYIYPVDANRSLNPSKWIEQYADILFSYAFMRVNRRDVAEDLVQDAFLSALKAQDSFRHESSEKTWLTAILKRKIIDYYRKKSTQSELNVLDNERKDGFMEHFFESDSGRDGHWASTAAPKAWGGDFDTAVERDEFQLVLKDCLDKLPEKWSAVFTLKNMDDMDSEEICKELQIAPSNYWVIMHRAKLQLRGCMEMNWFEKKTRE
jgi:RNA polymerase sigma-70 factor (TIGR02943 family)